MRVLVIDDDSDMLLLLKHRLEEKGFAVDTAQNGTYGSYCAKTNEYDLIILDYNLSFKDGFVICEEIRTSIDHRRASTPLIILSATSDLSHKIKGLTIGADDYLTKPFYFEELFARIQTILRRPSFREDPIISIDDLSINSTRQEVYRGDVCIYLTRKEFALLEYLARHRGCVISRSAIAEHVWDMHIDPFSNAIETHILNLRKKIECADRPKLIHNIPGRGYKLEAL